MYVKVMEVEAGSCCHSSSAPARVSMQELSVSEASVCSVDIDEMSLMEEDWEAVALLFTVPSTIYKHTQRTGSKQQLITKVVMLLVQEIYIY